MIFKSFLCFAYGSRPQTSILIEIENVMPAHVYMTIEDENEDFLTPNHFLLISAIGSKPLGVWYASAVR